MACRTETTTINGIEYACTQWAAETALLRQLELVETFGGALGTLANVTEENQIEILGKALQEVFAKRNPTQVLDLMKKCVVGVARDGTRLTEGSIQQHFSGDDLIDFYRVFFFAVKTNYAKSVGGFMQTMGAKGILN